MNVVSLLEEHDNCTSCGMCSAVCPKKCLEVSLNDDGFYRPFLNENSCVDCGLCLKVCPKDSKIIDNDATLSVSVVTRNEQTLKTTSSGGLAYELARAAILRGDKVCSCVYDYDEHIAKHVIIDNLDDLTATKGSKYFQSFTADAFEELVNSGDRWTVFGTPCQIASVHKYAVMKGIRDRFTLVDFFCHGTPSILLWKKYIEENGGNSIKEIGFRSKEYGWREFSLSIRLEDGSYKSDYKKNMFYRLFFSNLCLNDSCYDCRFKATSSFSDIRVGDYWGEKYSDNTTGVSSCICFTDSGAQLVSELSESCIITNESVDGVLEGQMISSPELKPERRRVLKALKARKGLSWIFNFTLFPYRLKQKIKSLFKRK